MLRLKSKPDIEISIHALLAESDAARPSTEGKQPYFYPRSPCGERHPASAAAFHAKNFYPRSPCGERRTMNNIHF